LRGFISGSVAPAFSIPISASFEARKGSYPYRLLIHLGTHSGRKRAKLSRREVYSLCQANYNYKSHTPERNAPKFSTFWHEYSISRRDPFLIAAWLFAFHFCVLFRSTLINVRCIFGASVGFFIHSGSSLPFFGSFSSHPPFFHSLHREGKKASLFCASLGLLFPFSLAFTKNWTA
jgi:hypothetical protein